jgi:dihydrofolate synthase/folylpolyglutamate synthase
LIAAPELTSGAAHYAWPWHERLRLPKFGRGSGLARTAALARPLLESPWGRALDALKVTGSNGKGSVAAMLAAMLAELGIDAGLTTSPHLFAFNERMAVRGQAVSSAELEAAWPAVEARAGAWQTRHPGDDVGAFEAITALALEVFARAGVRTVVAEAGIGGRHDPTRVIPGRVCALTSLDLEHTALLGTTLAEIACDKADLCPEGGTLVAAVSDGEASERLAAHCRARGVALVDALARGRVTRSAYGGDMMTVDLEIDGDAWRGVDLALRGAHQAHNALVAVLALREWLRAHEPSLPAARFEDAARRGLARVRWPGRFERVRRAPDVFADVGHTPEALRALAATVRAALPGRRVLLVAGVSHDKDAGGILAPLAALADEAVCTQAHHKGRAAEDVYAIVRRLRPELPATVESDVAAAVASACERAAAESFTVLVAGGLFLAAEATYALRGGDPRTLRFF